MSLAKTCLKTNLSKCSTINEPGQYQCDLRMDFLCQSDRRWCSASAWLHCTTPIKVRGACGAGNKWQHMLGISDHISTSSLRLWACVAVSQEPAGRQMWYRVHVVGHLHPTAQIRTAQICKDWMGWLSVTKYDNIQQLQARTRKYGTLTILFWNACTQAALPTPCSGCLLWIRKDLLLES